MRLILFILAVFSYLFTDAQLYNAQWALGYDESVLDFRDTDTVADYSISTLEYFTFTNACICDSQGNLLFYTNGINICGINGALLNGDGLSPCPYTVAEEQTGLDIQQAALFIPKPGSESYYYLFHFSNDTLDESRPGTIFYSLIDANGNNGLGEVISKNRILLDSVILREGGMTACKHANGRDYWLVMGGSEVNTYYKFLVTPDTILGPYTQDIGPAVSDTGDNSYSKFTWDGSRFATCFFAGPIILMDFDRCSGEFSNVQTIYNSSSYNPILYPIEGSASVEFSPSGRFLYADDRIVLNQYDLWSGDIQDSSAIYVADSTEQYWIDMLQLGPNGKLYGCTWNGGLSALHVVNYPDFKGDSSNFVYAGQPTLSIASVNVPNLINYRLGALAGPCDTIPAAISTAKSIIPIRAIPNPADKYLYVEMGAQGEYEFQLFNSIGQIVDKKNTR